MHFILYWLVNYELINLTLKYSSTLKGNTKMWKSQTFLDNEQFTLKLLRWCLWCDYIVL